ncbi:hypothetical protein CDAR_245861, partial [Caerostris darwini]
NSEEEEAKLSRPSKQNPESNKFLYVYSRTGLHPYSWQKGLILKSSTLTSKRRTHFSLLSHKSGFYERPPL